MAPRALRAGAPFSEANVMNDLTAADLSARARLLQVVQDGDDYVVGRPDLGTYVVVPKPGATFIAALQQGGSLAAATSRASEVAGEDVDGADFLDGLVEAGLLEPLAVASESPAAPAGRARRIRWIEGVSPRRARLLFGVPAWMFYTLSAAFAAGTLVGVPDLRPSWESLWFLPDPVLSVVVLVPIQLALAAFHEAWHWLAGRAAGIPAVFRVSYRGIFLAFETDLSQIVTLPRRQRYGPFLAGMAFDTVILALALGLRLLYRYEIVGLPAVVARLLDALVLGQLLRIALQWFTAFARSDGYAVLANALRCHNLYRTTWLTAKRRLWRLSPAEQAEYVDAGERDLKVARWFSLFYLLGLLGMAWVLLNVALPAAIAMVSWVLPNVASLAVGTVAFWESVAVLAYLAAQYGLPPLLAWRERRLRIAGALR
jgi:hypothetical protein